ncbi:PadR family transcriptional regulator [Acidobacteriota bacterium]
MKYLTRKEELILLTALKLKDEASLVKIRRQLIVSSGHSWSVGNVYVPLDRMTKMGYLITHLGTPTARRGGKAVKYYVITKQGKKALADLKKIHDSVWSEVKDTALE